LVVVVVVVVVCVGVWAGDGQLENVRICREI
jgi:hypothetical protein